ncbi:MAG: 6,7-dimethyl-8-ribityllumazine synthase [Thermoguttaceae bacterium]|nr:6,7-dimethyl-8-ribityllumazine synthase [Thermoguttaceae bacterium]
MIYEGDFHNDEHRYQFAIAVAKFNKTITQRLLDGAIWRLKQAGVTERQIDVFWVPGSFELPTIAEKLCCVHIGGVHLYNAVICLGAVIKGETSHDLHINQSISRHFIDISRTFEIPVMFGVLTCNNVEQANARSVAVEELYPTGKLEDVQNVPDKTVAAHLGNKGVDCAEAALEMVDLMEQIEELGNVEDEFDDDDMFDDDDYDKEEFDSEDFDDDDIEDDSDDNLPF